MAMDNRNNPSGTPGQQGEDTERTSQANDENPQQGAQWDNYQTRSLSSEGSDKIEEGDLLKANEASKQQPDSGAGI